MALKAKRYVPYTRVDYFMNEVAEKGGVPSWSTSGSGDALDQAENLVTYAANQSGKYPVGILLTDMVDLDLSRYHLNTQKNDVVQKGSKVNVLCHGWVLTNKYLGSPTAGAPAYLGVSGYLTPTAVANVTATVGRFEGTPDQDGYVKVFVNLP